MKKLILFLGICLVMIGFIVIFSQKLQPTQVSLISPTPQTNLTLSTSFAKVTRVFDGDTIEIESGQKVRYIGIDAAEVYPVRQCFSDDARIENEKLVLGKEVKLVKDVSETDKYGRLLRYVYIGDIFVNDELMKEGYTKVMTVPPDVKYKDEFIASENYAKENNLGLWSKCR